MPWGRIDDVFWRHRKVMGIGAQSLLPAVGLHWMAVSWCNDQLSDGAVPVGFLRLVGAKKSLADILVAVGLWEATDAGYAIHDYLEYNPSRHDVLAQREVDRRRAALNANPELARTVKERDGNQCRYCGVRVDWRDRKSAHGATYDHVFPLSRGGDDTADNIVVCCRSCNFRKGAFLLSEISMVLLDPPQISSPKSSPPVPVSRFPVPVSPSPEPAPFDAREGLPHIDAETVRVLERITGRPAANAGDKQLTELDRLLEDHPASKVRDALVTVSRGKKVTARQAIWDAVKLLEPFTDPKEIERAEKAAEEKRASDARFAATRRLIDEQERLRDRPA